MVGIRHFGRAGRVRVISSSGFEALIGLRKQLRRLCKARLEVGTVGQSRMCFFLGGRGGADFFCDTGMSGLLYQLLGMLPSTRTVAFLVADSYSPSCATVTGLGSTLMCYHMFVCFVILRKDDTR